MAEAVQMFIEILQTMAGIAAAVGLFLLMMLYYIWRKRPKQWNQVMYILGRPKRKR
jgi:heme O synthase-like polyprenyltransferase